MILKSNNKDRRLCKLGISCKTASLIKCTRCASINSTRQVNLNITNSNFDRVELHNISNIFQEEDN